MVMEEKAGRPERPDNKTKLKQTNKQTNRTATLQDKGQYSKQID